jgi:hypothetical protein
MPIQVKSEWVNLKVWKGKILTRKYPGVNYIRRSWEIESMILNDLKNIP